MTLDRRSHVRLMRAAAPPALEIVEPAIVKKNNDTTKVKTIVAAMTVEVDRITIGEVSRAVKERTGLDFGGPTLAKYLKGLGFARVRQGIYARAGATR